MADVLLLLQALNLGGINMHERLRSLACFSFVLILNAFALSACETEVQHQPINQSKQGTTIQDVSITGACKLRVICKDGYSDVLGSYGDYPECDSNDDDESVCETICSARDGISECLTYRPILT
jgi:hypothetical protein